MWRPKQLTRSQKEERRLAAGRLLKAGKQSQAEIARQMSVSRMAVSHWARDLREQGIAGLRSRPPTGRPPALSPAQWRQVLALLRKGARAAGWDTERWTLQRIGQLIEREFGVPYHPNYLSERLKHSHWSAQKPASQARERDAEWVETWLKRDWPRIKKKRAVSGQKSCL